MSTPLLKMLAPMAKQNLPLVEKLLCQRLAEITLNDGENYAAYVVTVANDHAHLSLCTFTSNDQCSRVITTNNATDELLKLLKLV